MKWEINMEWILLGVGLLVGGGVGFGAAKLSEPKPPLVIEDKTSQEQQEVIKQLTNLDLIMPLCTPDKEGKLDHADMCRYLACLQYSRGIDSQTSGAECEKISNQMSSRAVLDHCMPFYGDAVVNNGIDQNSKFVQCLVVYGKRK